VRRNSPPERKTPVPLARSTPSYRCKAASDTLKIATALMPTLGISRVTDITRMDRLGLPVFASVRPRGKALRVHAGKSLDPTEARVGALMEAIEYAAADPLRSASAVRPLRVDELLGQFDGGLHLIDFVPELGREVRADESIPVIGCEEILRGRPAQLPAELIFVPSPTSETERLFGSSSTGLASGNSLAEATLHALLEVLERDAISMNKPRDESHRIETADLPAPFSELAASWRDVGVELAVHYVPNLLGLPCFEAWLHEPGSAAVNLAGGSGLHLDRDLALAKAVCESAQSRLSHIHGGRDDITKFYSKYDARSATADAQSRLIRAIFAKDRTIRFSAVPTVAAQDLGVPETLRSLLEEMAVRGLGSVFRHRFEIELHGLHVTRVVVPKCEDVEHNPRRIGPRLLARILADA